jgi:hypothetical protein
MISVTCALAGSMASRLSPRRGCGTGVAVEHRLRQGDRDDDQFVGIHSQPLAGRGEDADDAETTVTDAYQLAERLVAAEHLIAYPGADDCFGHAATPVARRQETPLRERQAAHFDEVGRGAGNHHLAQLAADTDLRRADGQWCDAVHGAGAPQRLRVVDRQVARRAGDGVAGIEAAGLRAARQNDHQIAADRRKLVQHVAACAIAERRQDDHGGNADGHREDQEEGAQGLPVAASRAKRIRSGVRMRRQPSRCCAIGHAAGRRPPSAVGVARARRGCHRG